MTAIRRCDTSDAAMLADLGRRTFSEAYGQQTTPEELEEHTSDAFAEEQIRSELSNPESAFHVAEVSGRPAGFTKLNVGGLGAERARPRVLEAHGVRGVREPSVRVRRRQPQRRADAQNDRSGGLTASEAAL
jgi:diamine N-acetyltransferase